MRAHNRNWNKPTLGLGRSMKDTAGVPADQAVQAFTKPADPSQPDQSEVAEGGGRHSEEA